MLEMMSKLNLWDFDARIMSGFEVIEVEPTKPPRWQEANKTVPV